MFHDALVSFAERRGINMFLLSQGSKVKALSPQTFVDKMKMKWKICIICTNKVEN